MDIQLKERRAKDFDAIISPDDNVIFRCVECQSFLLPKHVGNLVWRWRQPDGTVGVAPILICPFCYSNIRKPEDMKLRDNEDMPQSYFITLTRHQYEQTRTAERWGMTYDPKTDSIQSKLLVH